MTIRFSEPPGPGSLGDFFRSGPGAGGSLLPDGVTDTTDPIVHNGRLALGALDPTLTHTQFQSQGGFAPGVAVVAGTGGAPGVGVGTLLGDVFNVISTSGTNILLPLASTVGGRVYEFHNFTAAAQNLNGSAAGNLFLPGDAVGQTTISIPSRYSVMAFSNGAAWLVTAQKRVCHFYAATGVTDAGGNVTFTYPTPYTVLPVVTGQIGPSADTALVECRLTASTTTSNTFNVRRSPSVIVLGIALLSVPANAPGVTVQMIAMDAGEFF